MQFSSVFVASLMSALLVSANPIPDNIEESGAVLLETIPWENDTIAVYDTSAVVKANKIDVQLACGDNTVYCDFESNRAEIGLCQGLLSYFRSDPNALVSNGKSWCRNRVVDNRGLYVYCCASTSGSISGLKMGHFADAHEKMINSCTSNSKVSARTAIGSTNLNGVCTTQCVSNRWDGC